MLPIGMNWFNLQSLKKSDGLQQNIVREFEAYEADYVGIYGLDTEVDQ